MRNYHNIYGTCVNTYMQKAYKSVSEPQKAMPLSSVLQQTLLVT